jgi:hypothetical protein
MMFARVSVLVVMVDSSLDVLASGNIGLSIVGWP